MNETFIIKRRDTDLFYTGCAIGTPWLDDAKAWSADDSLAQEYHTLSVALEDADKLADDYRVEVWANWDHETREIRARR